MPKSSFEDHMRIVEGSHTKTASASKVTPSLLDKLAAEMAGAVEAPAKAAVAADATVAEAAPAVVAATEAITVPQTTIAGGNEAEKVQGMQPAPSKPAAVIIGDGDKKVTDSQNFSKEPAAVAEAAKDTGGSEKTSSDKEAEEIGRTMARSYVDEMRKIAVDEQYSKSVEILKEAGLLDGYKLDESLEKKASEETTGLDKIANKQPLTKEDMVKAANEYVELSKQAEEADAFGRQQAHVYFDNLVKQAQEEEMKESEEEEKETAAQEKKEGKEKEEKEKKASDSALEKAVSVLVKAGVIKV
jgi:hypothetical protein